MDETEFEIEHRTHVHSGKQVSKAGTRGSLKKF